MVRIILIVVSLVVAVGSGWLTKRFIETERNRIARSLDLKEAPEPEGDEVLIVVTDVPIGGIISSRMLDWQFWPDDNILDIHITRSVRPNAPAELNGVGARQTLFEGDPVVEGKIVRPGDGGFLAAVLTTGKRAVTINVDQETGVAGLIHPGDRVDVILTHSPPSMFGQGGGAESARDSTAAETILRNIRILAVGKSFETDRSEATKGTPRTVTMEVAPHQAETLALGRSMGRLSLVLRSSFGDQTDSDERRRYFTRDVEISEVMQQGQRHPRILVAVQALEAGSLVDDLDFQWLEPEFSIDERDLFIEGRDRLRQLRGSLLLSDLESSAPLQRRMLLRPEDPSFVSRALRPGLRAVSLPVDSSTAVSGFITPGDLVDVVLTDQWEDERDTAVLKTRYFGETIATRVRVLSLPLQLNTDAQEGNPEQSVSSSATATLEVTAAQAESLALALDMGRLTLVLRSQTPGPDLAEPEASPWVEPFPKLAAHRENRMATALGGGPPGSFSFELDTSDALKALVVEPLLERMRWRRRPEPDDLGSDQGSITVFRGSQGHTVPLR